MYDLIIIGGGPGGYTAAAKAARNGLKTLLIEKRALGGTCLNEGCIPAKAFLYSAKLWNSVGSMNKYGIEAKGESFKQEKVVARKNKIVRKLVAGIKGKMEKSGVEVLLGEAEVLSATIEKSVVKVEEKLFESRYLVLAMGSETVVPPFKGIESTPFLTSRETLDLKELPSSMVIIGAGSIGMEFAAYFCRLNVKVTVVEMLPEILSGMDREVSALLREEYAKKGIDFYLESKVTEVSSTCVTIENAEGTQDIPADRILISTGRRPVLAGCERLNLEMNGKGIKVDAQMRTSIPSVFAIGDLTAFSQLAHTAVREAEVAVDCILGKDTQMRYNAIPGVVYTDPEVAGVGYTEEQLQAQGIVYRKKALNMTFSGRFVVENEQTQGLCKVLVDEKDRILGVHMYGNPSGELILSAGIAIDCGIPASRLSEVVFAHPTVGEILKETIESSSFSDI